MECHIAIKSHVADLYKGDMERYILNKKVQNSVYMYVCMYYYYCHCII